MLTKQDITEVIPPHLKANVSDDLVTLVNNISSDPENARNIRDNFISYTSVLKEGRFKMEDYLNAVAYVSYKLMGETNLTAYKKTFPQRYGALRAKGTSEKEISAYVSIYNRGRLVNLILEQTLIPSWILNQDVYQKAINTQAELMMTANSEKVRTEAANSILTHLKKPEKKEIELNLGMTDNSGMKELSEMLTDLAKKQQSLIGEGVSTKEIAHQPLMRTVNPVEDAEIIKDEK